MFVRPRWKCKLSSTESQKQAREDSEPVFSASFMS